MPVPTLTNVSRPRALGYSLALNEDLFRLAASPVVQIETDPPGAPRVDTAANPNEIVNEHGRVFARSEFEGGEGLFRAHVEGAAQNRYWDSRGVNIGPSAPDEFPELELAHETEQLRSSAADPIRLATDGTSLWMTDEASLFRTDNPTAATPTFSEDDPHTTGTEDVEDVAALGDTVYAALGTDGVTKRDPSTGNWSDYSNVEAVRVWTAQARLIVSDGTSLYELTDGDPNPSALITVNSGEQWNDVADGGSAVLAAASDGYVYAFTNESGTLTLAGQTDLPGEQPVSLAATQGRVAIGTRQGDIGRLWVGAISETTFVVGDRQLLREWRPSGTVDRQPHKITADRTSFYTGVALDGYTDIWRYDLRTGGLSRHLYVADEESCSDGILVLEGTLFFALCGAGLYREADTFVADSYLIGPLGDFLSASSKSWVGARLETGTIPSGATVELYYTTDPDDLSDPESSGWVRAIARSAGDNSPEKPLVNVVARSIAGMVKLYPPSAADVTPVVRAMEFRAFPSAADGDVVITMQVNVSDQIARNGRHRQRIRGHGEKTYARLATFEGRPVLLRLYRPQETVRGLVESVSTRVPSPDSRGSVTHISTVTVRGRRVGSVTSITGTGAFATGHKFATSPKFGAKT